MNLSFNVYDIVYSLWCATQRGTDKNDSLLWGLTLGYAFVMMMMATLCNTMEPITFLSTYLFTLEIVLIKVDNLVQYKVDKVLEEKYLRFLFAQKLIK